MDNTILAYNQTKLLVEHLLETNDNKNKGFQILITLSETCKTVENVLRSGTK